MAVSIRLMIILFFLNSCDGMNDIQRQYTEKREQVYLGKVDSLKSQPGFGRAKITWFVSADPKIEKTVIYWNMRRDSIVKDFIRTSSGIQKDSIVVENLPEGSTLFEFRNENRNGETSLFSSLSVLVWGKQFAETLYARKLISREFNYDRSIYILGLSPVSNGDSVIYSQIEYTDNAGIKRNIRIERETNTIELEGFNAGSEFHFRNVFFLSEGLDTVYTDYQKFTSPSALFEKGKKISLGQPNSRYSSYNDKGLYEWNSSGDLILYTLNGDGSFSESYKFASLVPRNTYRDFFFYDDDKFLSISKENTVSLHRIIDQKLHFVKNPSGTDVFGVNFGMPKFIPAKGFFFSIDTQGALRTWFANNNATWGSPNGTTVSSTFSYEPVCLFNEKYLIGVDGDGYLWSTPISPIGLLGNKSIIGSGWNKFVQLISTANKLIAIDSNGDFYQFDFNATDYFWIVK